MEGKWLSRDARGSVINSQQGESNRRKAVCRRNGFFDKLLSTNRQVGELETRLLQLESPNNP
jgi:hypothetical protein